MTRSLSNIPLMEWSRPPVDIPWALRHFLLNYGCGEMELESVAIDIMSRYDDINDMIAEQF